MKAERTKVNFPKIKRGAIPQLFIKIYPCQTTLEACSFTKVKNVFSIHLVNNLKYTTQFHCPNPKLSLNQQLGIGFTLCNDQFGLIYLFTHYVFTNYVVILFCIKINFLK